MKKKIFILLVALLFLIFIFAGCEDNNVSTSKVGDITLIKVVNGENFDIYVDKDTRVMYIFNKTTYQGGMTVLINSDGSPMLWEGDL